MGAFPFGLWSRDLITPSSSTCCPQHPERREQPCLAESGVSPMAAAVAGRELRGLLQLHGSAGKAGPARDSQCPSPFPASPGHPLQATLSEGPLHQYGT